MSKQQTSLLSFFACGGRNNSSKTNDDPPPAAAPVGADACPAPKSVAAAASKGARQSIENKSLARASAATNKRRRSTSSTCRPVVDEDTKQQKQRKKAATASMHTRDDACDVNNAADAATCTTTPCKLQSVPDLTSFSYSRAQVEGGNDNVVSTGESPLSTASTAASTPPCSPIEEGEKKKEDMEDCETTNVIDKSVNDNDHVPSTCDDDNFARTNDNDDESSEEEISDDDDDNDSDTCSDDDIDPHKQRDSITGEHKLSDYELLRLRNIERNNRRLAELGLGGGWSSAVGAAVSNSSTCTKKQRRKVKGDATKIKTAALPTRRSTRNRRSVLGASTNEETATSISRTNYQEVSTEVAEEEEPEIFTVSPMLEYAMGSIIDTISHTDTSADTHVNEWSTTVSPDSITCLKPIGKRLIPPSGLGAIYSLQFYPKEWNPPTRSVDSSWIVGAGKAGIVSLWDCNWSRGDEDSGTADDDEVNMIDPILSWKAHSGRWVADVRFLPIDNNNGTNKAPPSRLLSAANDGCVCLWDLSAVSVQSGAPKLLSKTGKELHRSGIFAMDVTVGQQQSYVCTGSKDKTVAVTTLEAIAQGNFAAPVWLSDYHTAKVGAVALRGKGTSLLASASDDGSIAVHDFRVNGKNEVVAELPDAHNRPHSVVWNPLSENELMTAGLDDQVKVFDIRSLDRPLLSYFGHVPSNLAKYKRIHHPVFYNPCKTSVSADQFVLSGGENSRSLSMFRNHDAKDTRVSVYSRGKLPSDCGDAGCLSVQDEKVASTIDGGEVLLLSPQTKK